MPDPVQYVPRKDPVNMPDPVQNVPRKDPVNMPDPVQYVPRKDPVNMPDPVQYVPRKDPVNMLDPIRIRSGSAGKHWPEAGRTIPAHWLASGPDPFGPTPDTVSQN